MTPSPTRRRREVVLVRRAETVQLAETKHSNNLEKEYKKT
jgi:hypothetical protein